MSLPHAPSDQTTGNSGGSSSDRALLSGLEDVEFGSSPGLALLSLERLSGAELFESPSWVDPSPRRSPRFEDPAPSARLQALL